MGGESEATKTPRAGAGYPARSRYQGAVAKDYLEGRVHDPRWQREQDVIEAFLQGLPAGSTIVDLPLGTGRFVEFYAAFGHTVYGVDVSRDMVAQARREAATHQGSLVPVLGEAERIPLRDGAVDNVVCVRFLNWVPLPVATRILSEFHRIARKKVLVHIRTKEPLDGPGLARTLAGELSTQPVSLLRRFAGAIRLGLRSLAPGSADNAAPEATGHVLHDATRLEEAFKKVGFAVLEKTFIESTTAYAKSQSEPLNVYVLGRAEQDD